MGKLSIWYGLHSKRYIFLWWTSLCPVKPIKSVSISHYQRISTYLNILKLFVNLCYRLKAVPRHRVKKLLVEYIIGNIEVTCCYNVNFIDFSIVAIAVIFDFVRNLIWNLYAMFHQQSSSEEFSSSSFVWGDLIYGNSRTSSIVYNGEHLWFYAANLKMCLIITFCDGGFELQYAISRWSMTMTG